MHEHRPDQRSTATAQNTGHFGGVASVTPVHIESARGAVVRDVEGKEYIDFGGGIGS